MTVGELAQMYNDHFIPQQSPPVKPVQLTIVYMQNWHRGMFYEQTELPFVMPSPNIPTMESAWAYLGFGYLEGTNCSTGRGTTRPFELVGAPYMVNGTLPRALQALNLPGVSWREVTTSLKLLRGKP
jgi:uncharacterized protein YbbC (DUF1343 family)